MAHVKITFPGQRSGERILHFTRRHWIQFLYSVLATAALAGAYFGALMLVLRFTPVTLAGAEGFVVTTVTGVTMLMLWLFLYIKFIDYYLDVWILTDERIVQIKQKSLFNRQIAEFDLASVQDVSSKTKGILGTFLQFGTLFVQTAGARELFDFSLIPRPNIIEKKILDAQAGLEAEAKREIGELVATNQPDSTGHANPPPATDSQMREVKKRFRELE